MHLQPKKSLGQHFLNSPSALAKIIEAANLEKGEVVLEIGPGTGILTRALLETGAKVMAIEKDARACEFISEKFKQEIASSALGLERGDVLELNREKIGLADTKYAVIANIPYYITGAILQSFLECSPRPNRMVLLIQKDVADRIIARDGKESVLSISVKAFGDPELIAKVPPGAFVPPPSVDSAIIAIRDIRADLFIQNNIEIRRFFGLVKAGFAHKRKYLKSNLEAVLAAESIASMWKRIGLDEKVRAEDLPLERWVDIAREQKSQS